MDLSPTEIRTVVIGAMLALFLAALDQTVVATALPSIAKDLGGFALISWIVTAYLLTATCVTPLVGKLSDLYGRRVVLRICLGVFILGSVLCALAPSMILLILARAVQGVGGGGLMTMAQTIIGDVVSPRERGRYAGYFSIVWGSSSVLGPTIGGVVTDQIGWPWIFWINLPLGLLALVISDHALRKLPVAGRRSTLEFAGIVLLCAATIALLLIFSLGGHRLAWGSPQILILAVAALALAASFVWQQRQSPEPIFPSRFFRDGVTAPVLASIFVVYGSYLAVAVLAPSYFQVALGSSVSEAGLLMIPFMLSSTLTANLAGQYSRRSGRYKPPPLIGLPVAALSLAVLPLIAERLSAFGIAMVLMVTGSGLARSFPVRPLPRKTPSSGATSAPSPARWALRARSAEQSGSARRPRSCSGWPRACSRMRDTSPASKTSPGGSFRRRRGRTPPRRSSSCSPPPRSCFCSPGRCS
jgi:EmrB/QacA subfamily drug resistance transporter